MTYSTTELWAIIFAVGIGSWALRYSFLGLVGDRKLPDWVLRHLKYTAVGILPGLVAPMVLFPAATDGQIDPARLIAAGVALAVGVIWKNVLAAIIAGASTLYLMLNLLG